jgi:hypothetical protein
MNFHWWIIRLEKIEIELHQLKITMQKWKNIQKTKKDSKKIKLQNKLPTKISLMWEVSKEQEQNFKHAILDKYPSNRIKDGDGYIDIDELFKLIRGSEYRRGKEDALKELEDSKDD